MAINSINGGLIELTTVRTPFHGIGLRVYIDQSSNIQNGDSDANIILSLDECKNIINQISAHLERIEGVPYVYLSAPVDEFRKSEDFKLFTEFKNKLDQERLEKEQERLELERIENERIDKLVNDKYELEKNRLEKEIQERLEKERLEREQNNFKPIIENNTEVKKSKNQKNKI
jgi:hypothetical protein